MASINHNFTLDQSLKLKDAGLVTSTAVTQVSSADVTIDLGADAYQRGAIVVDVSACEVADGNELFVVQLQGAAASNFSTAYQLATLRLGDSSVTGNATDTVAGRFVLYFDNVAQTAAGEVANMRYLRLRTVVSGTVGTGINYQAWAVKLH